MAKQLSAADRIAARNRIRFLESCDKLWDEAITQFTAGELLYAFLDGAVGRLKPSEADRARKSALQALRRRAARVKKKLEPVTRYGLGRVR